MKSASTLKKKKTFMFLKRVKPTRLAQEKIDNLKSPVSIKHI